MTEEAMNGGAWQKQESDKRSSNPVDEIAAGARLVGLAALGVLVTIGEGGNRIFQTLVERGEKFEPEGRERMRETSERVGKAFGTAAANVETTFRDLGGKVRDFASRSESALDEKVAAAMNRFGVPNREDIQKLADRVDAMAAKLEELRAKLRDAGTPPDAQPSS